MDPVKTDRCIDIFRKPGEKGHVGKDLRKVSKEILKKFPNLNPDARICCACRKKSKILDNNECVSDSSYNADDSVHSEYDDGSDLETTASSTASANIDNRSQREKDLEEMLDGLKHRFSSLPKNDPMRLRILTICPTSWGERKIAREFNASRYLANKSKQLKSKKGILGETVAKQGKELPQEILLKVDEFYNDDANSRMTSTTKDVISVKNEDGLKEEKQKRLLLLNLKELYASFKNSYPKLDISFSKFASLRPKHCILPGASGTHSVCVCTIHQNVKMMLDAINIKELTRNSEMELADYKDCIKYMVCEEPTHLCYLDNCDKCPGISRIIDFLRQKLEDSCISDVQCSLWTSTDRSTLVTETFTVGHYLAELRTKLKNLKIHSYIAKQQTSFIKEKKINLATDEVLVMFDFSENYAYVCQDAAQAFHFNNNQCTVFPVIYYYKDANEVKHKSLIFLSESLKHDTAAVHAIQKLLIPEIKRDCRKLKKIYYVTDGAKQHFKNRFQMSNLINHKKDFHIEAEWHYTATAHGKSMYDGIGATFKKAAYLASLTAKPADAILTPEALYAWAKKKFSSISVIYFDQQYHERVRRSLNKRFAECNPVPEISKNHAFIVGKDKLMIKSFSNSKTYSSMPI